MKSIKELNSPIINPAFNWKELRADFIQRIYSGFALLALLSIPISLFRAFETGFQPAMAFHLFIGLMLIALHPIHQSLSIRTKASLLVLGCTGIGLVGLFNWGILGNGMLWFIIAALLITCFYPIKYLLYFIALIAISSVTAAGLFLNGFLSFPSDADAYLLNPSAWGATIIGSIGFIIIALYGLGHFQHSLQQLLFKVQFQQQQITHLANHDILTGLPSLRLAEERFTLVLQRANREKSSVGVLFLDLDKFKPINDEFGHSTGDQVLKILASRLAKITREIDTIARIGGDEFLMITPVADPLEDLSSIAERITQSIQTPFVIGENEFQLSISIGVAVYPEDGNNAHELTSKADVAMYQAKRDPGSNTMFYGDMDNKNSKTA